MTSGAPTYGRIWRPALLVLVALSVTACGSSSTAASRSRPTIADTTTTTKPLTLSERYKLVVSDGDAQLQRLSAELSTANGNVPLIQAKFREVAATYRHVAAQVQAMSFPPSVRADVTAMTGALATLATDSDEGARAATLAQFNAVFTRLAADQKAEVTANNAVNHDLGISSIS